MSDHINASDEFLSDSEKVKLLTDMCERAYHKNETMKIDIVKMHLEEDVANKELRLVLTSDTGKEWVVSHQSMCMEGGGMAVIVEKEKCWYFDEKNKIK